MIKNIRISKLSLFCLMCIIAIICVFFVPSRIFGQTEDMSAEDILNKVDDLYRGESSQGVMTMSITTENWSRDLTLEFWSLGKEMSLFRILAPKKEKGTTTLKNEDDIWNYLPKVNRTIKLPSSMMSQSWMGSHFTNDDLVKESRFTEDYDFEITFRGERDEREVIEITCLPKEDAAVVWGKVVAVIEKDTYLPVEITYYDEDLELARTMTFMEIRKLDDREIPTVMHVLPADKPGEVTIVTYNEVEFDIDIDEGFFSLRNLQK